MDGRSSSTMMTSSVDFALAPEEKLGRPSKQRRRKRRRSSPSSSSPIPIPSFFVQKISFNTLKITAVSTSDAAAAAAAAAIPQTTTTCAKQTTALLLLETEKKEAQPSVSSSFETSIVATCCSSNNNVEENLHPSSSSSSSSIPPPQRGSKCSPAASSFATAAVTKFRAWEQQQEQEEEEEEFPCTQPPPPPPLQAVQQSRSSSSSSNHRQHHNSHALKRPVVAPVVSKTVVPASTSASSPRLRVISQSTPPPAKVVQEIMQKSTTTTTQDTIIMTIHHDSPLKNKQQQQQKIAQQSPSPCAATTTTTKSIASSSSIPALFVEKLKNNKKRCGVLVDQSSDKRNYYNNNNITCHNNSSVMDQKQPMKKRTLEAATTTTIISTTLEPLPTCTHNPTTGSSTLLPSGRPLENMTTSGGGGGVLCVPPKSSSSSILKQCITTTAEPRSRQECHNNKSNTNHNMELKTVTFACTTGSSGPHFRPVKEAAENGGAVTAASKDICDSKQQVESPSLFSNAPPPPPPRQFVLYFVASGRDMTPASQLGWPKQNARNRGATVLEEFDHRRYEKKPGQHQLPVVMMPTHFIVSDYLRQDDLESAERMAVACSFASLVEMAEFCHQYGIVCATRAWAAATVDVHAVDYFYDEPILKKEFPPREVYLLPPPTARRWPTTLATIAAVIEPPVVVVGNRNVALSDLFLRLSKLYQGAPWNGMDDIWKSYSFNNIAGRLRYLEFEVIAGGQISPATLRRLKKVKGIGKSTLDIIQEFVEKQNDDDFKDSPAQEIQRILDLEQDENRVAMKAMMNIHGVGPVKAKELVEAGYKTIEDLRQAVNGEDQEHNNGGRQKRATVSLNRNQYVGILCYEDLLERMPASEVEAIAETVKQAVFERYPSAEITVMGSFRRKQRNDFGDVDILITHCDYQDSVPSEALGLIVDRLKARNKIAHHLTLISGMDEEAYDEDLDGSVLERIGAHTNRKAKKAKKATCSMYMGIFKSPTIHGKLRRVDIKWYPYRERVFASLYFTGNGYFNRSMRLWARKEGMQLNDHGLFARSDLECKVGIMHNPPSTEREVFDTLGLVWKEPHDRDGFHAVVGAKKKSSALQLEGELEVDDKAFMKEFREAEQQYTWIN